MSKEAFKEFVKKNPALLKHVNNNNMSWQKFYEMYDIYGEENEIWGTYLKEEKKEVKNATNIGDFMNYLKNMNIDNVQESIGSIQRVLGVLGDLTNKNETPAKSTYEPKPIYKHFDD